ncbi:hypothetical protein OROGR_001802 [Orobanche gracilis]
MEKIVEKARRIAKLNSLRTLRLRSSVDWKPLEKEIKMETDTSWWATKECYTMGQLYFKYGFDGVYDCHAGWARGSEQVFRVRKSWVGPHGSYEGELWSLYTGVKYYYNKIMKELSPEFHPFVRFQTDNQTLAHDMDCYFHCVTYNKFPRTAEQKMVQICDLLKELGVQPEFLYKNRAGNELSDCLCLLAHDT